MSPLKHAHLFQRNLNNDGNPVYAYVGLLEIHTGTTLKEDSLHILTHVQDKLLKKEGALRDTFTLCAVDENTEWGSHINNSMRSAKRDFESPHPTVTEYLKMPCWPRFSTDPTTEDLLHNSSFRVFTTERPDTYIMFGVSTHPLAHNSPDEAWLSIDPHGSTLMKAPCKTEGSTLDQVLTQPVWKASDESVWVLSYNNATALQVYDQLNQLAVQWFKGALQSEAYNDAVMAIQNDYGIGVQSNRLIRSNDFDGTAFQKYIALRTILMPQDAHQMMKPADLANKLDQTRVFELSLQGETLQDIIPLLTQDERHTIAMLDSKQKHKDKTQALDPMSSNLQKDDLPSL